jgi:ubiquinone/menaquinone biosynthesis C-methylase UbiE
MLSTIYYKFIRKIITRKDEQNQYSGGFWPRLIRDTAADMLKGYTGRIAELGCGEGIFLEKALRNNPSATIYGIDSWDEILQKAKARLNNAPNAVFIHSDARSSGVENSFLDYVFCLNTIYNLNSVEDIKSLFTEVKRILKPGGRFIFDIRNSLNPIIALQYKFVKFYDPGITVPLRAYRIGYIEQILNDSGFKTVDKVKIGAPKNMFVPAVIFVAEKL